MKYISRLDKEINIEFVSKMSKIFNLDEHLVHLLYSRGIDTQEKLNKFSAMFISKSVSAHSVSFKAQNFPVCKSIFNLIWDKLSLDSDAYDVKSQADIYTIKTRLAEAGVEFTYYEDNYKDMWE